MGLHLVLSTIENADTFFDNNVTHRSHFEVVSREHPFSASLGEERLKQHDSRPSANFCALLFIIGYQRSLKKQRQSKTHCAGIAEPTSAKQPSKIKN
jgi:hypothetical protein